MNLAFTIEVQALLEFTIEKSTKSELNLSSSIFLSVEEHENDKI
jgi:hypothetical protein